MRKGPLLGGLSALFLLWLALPGGHWPDPGLARFAGQPDGVDAARADWVPLDLRQIALAAGAPDVSLEAVDRRIRDWGGIDLSGTRPAGGGPSLPAGPIPRPVPPRPDAARNRTEGTGDAPFGSALFAAPADRQQAVPLFGNSGWLAAEVQALRPAPETDSLRRNSSFGRDRDTWDRFMDPFSDEQTESLLGAEPPASDPFRDSSAASPWDINRGTERNPSRRRLDDDWLR